MQEFIQKNEQMKNIEIPENLKEKKELLLNALNWFISGRVAQEFINRIFILESFRYMGEKIPAIEDIIKEINSIQSDEGTWKKGHEHYVPTTAAMLLFYKRMKITPEKTLDSFFSNIIDTWEKTKAHNIRYQPDNYWGGLWGYVGCYAALGQRPPWADKFLEETNKRFDEWAQDNHQRAHVIDCFRQLKEPVPRAAEIIALTLKDQLPDGRWTAKGWNPALPQTTNGIATLKILDPQGTPETHEAIKRGIAFIDQCFKIVQWKGKRYGGYTTEPENPYPDPLSTSMAIITQLHPEKLEELTGYKELNR